MKNVVAVLLAVALTVSAFAHEGEDHSEPAAPSSVAEAHPRAATATELFELVAVAQGDRLMLYLDRFATNEPVSAAGIEIESDALKVSAVEVEPGVYQAVADRFAHPGPHLLTIEVRAGDDVDLLSLVVDGVSASAARPATPAGGPAREAQAWRHPLVWGASGAGLLAGAGVLALRRKARRAQTRGGQ